LRNIETKILWLCLILFVAYIIALLLMGCASQQSGANVIWHDGRCLLYVEGISASQAAEVTKYWEFTECEITVESEMGEGSIGPGDPG